MTNIQRVRVDIVTDASGDFTVDTPEVSGRVLWYRYVPAASNDLDANWDLDIVGKNTGVVVADHSNLTAAAATFAPRQATHGIDGSASLYAATGEPVEDYIWVKEALTVTVAQGGNVQSGTLWLLIG
jgi:hypothetical protein